MAKSKNKPKPFDVKPKATPPKTPTVAPVAKSHAVRETVESIVIAFVLAFLFRTFEAEAFVIPTGSMAPTLMGRHKDVECPKCGYSYEVSASEEEPSLERNQTPSPCLAGMCPMCRYVMPMRPDLPPGMPEKEQANIRLQPSYNGDRILVNKYVYAFSDPQRWDVVVFKFPGDAKTNYIKRLVGLPGETLRIFQGNVFIRPPGSANNAEPSIERKPPDKVLAMRQLVHDTNFDPAELDAAGWPLRWHAPPGDANKWQLEKSIVGKNVRQTYRVDAAGDAVSWLRYEHLVPTYEVWREIATAANQQENRNVSLAANDRSRWRRLITDSNPYNGREDRDHLNYPTRSVNSRNSLEVDHNRQGLHWVGELMLEADVDVESASGELLLDLVNGGQHFGCVIDLKSGEARLSAANLADFSPQAQTALKGPGKHHVLFANVDEQLLLWVDGKLVPFDGSTVYDVDKIFGKREDILPQTSDKDLGDLAPAGIGARGAKLSVSRLQVWRDIYYIAATWERTRPGEQPVTDWNNRFREGMVNLASNPSLWSLFRERDSVDFPIGDAQLFVMGDNSAESSDARLWFGLGENQRMHSGGAYLDKRLLIGKALCVYWPHSWNRIPGTPIPFPLFPNFGDMRLVR
jgi:signal peptidase I